jgi:hypothetical protein
VKIPAVAGHSGNLFAAVRAGQGGQRDSATWDPHSITKPGNSLTES